jgi:hypothetical protein
MQAQIKDIVGQAIIESEDKIHILLKSFDSRIVQVRKEFDIEAMRRELR